MPRRSPTSSFEQPAAISSTTWRCRSVIGGAGCMAWSMPTKLTPSAPSSHRPNGVKADRYAAARLAADRGVERRRLAGPDMRLVVVVPHDDGHLFQLPAGCWRRV